MQLGIAIQPSTALLC